MIGQSASHSTKYQLPKSEKPISKERADPRLWEESHWQHFVLSYREKYRRQQKLGNRSFSQQVLVVFQFYNSSVVLKFEETAEE